MNRNLRFALRVILIGLLSLLALPTRAADPQYKLLKEIKVGGGGGWDYLSVDAVGRRLYVAHGTKIVVIDIDKDAVVGEILDTPGVHGFVAVPELKRGFSSNGQQNTSSVVDLETLKTLSRVTTEANPDAILYESGEGTIYTFNGRGHSATIFEAKTGKVLANVPVGGKPETGVADSAAGKVYVNIEDKNEIVVIDTKTHQVVNHWPIAPGEAATGLAFDAEHHRLFIGCGNQYMVMMDSADGKVIGNVKVGQGVDAAAFDPGTQLAFAPAGGSGNVTIAHEDSPDKLTVVQTLTTERGARTMAVDPKTHKIYLANAKNRQDPTSFKVLVYGRE
jgi:DNA-binding beta-propeller fold protein YncE